MNRSILATAAAAAALSACAMPAAVVAQPAHSAHAAMPGKPVMTPLARTGRTISGQPLKLPQGDAEMVAAAVDIPAGGAIAIHKHPWSRFVYVERGTLRVVNHVTGATLDFPAGTMLAEVIDQWHEGRAVGGAAARIVVVDLVPPGASNMVMQAPPAR